MEHISSASTISTDLAACLCTLGIPRHPERPLEVLVGDAQQVAFYFVGNSPCGDYSAAECIQAWSDRDWQNLRPQHPLTYIRCALRNRQVLIEYAHEQCQCGIVSRGNGSRLHIVKIRPEHRFTPAKLDWQTSRDGPANDSLRTESIELAACLLACGVPLLKCLPVTRQAGRLTFFFAPSDLSGLFQTAPLMLAWQDKDWHLSHPEHPFAYLACAIRNRHHLLGEIRNHPTTVCILQRNGLPAFLSLNAPPALEKTFLAELNA